jgi:hypothetical protein
MGPSFVRCTEGRDSKIAAFECLLPIAEKKGGRDKERAAGLFSPEFTTRARRLQRGRGPAIDGDDEPDRSTLVRKLFPGDPLEAAEDNYQDIAFRCYTTADIKQRNFLTKPLLQGRGRV